jgi:hypothetical protein
MGPLSSSSKLQGHILGISPSTETVGAQAFSDPMVSRAIALARPVFAGPPQSAERNCSVFRMLAEAFVRTIKRDYVRVSSCGAETVTRTRHDIESLSHKWVGLAASSLAECRWLNVTRP